MKTGTWGGVRHGNAGAAAALLLAMVAGCGGERPQEEEVSGDALAGTEATTTEDSLAAEAPEDLPRWRTAPVELQFAAHRERFTHDPHVEVGCSVCHASVPGHTVHATEECSQCHGAVNLASRRRFREGECLACHHAADQRRNCTQCHASVAPRTVQRSVRLEISGESRERDLPFDHARHVDRRCGECHEETPARPATTECGACHQEHHEPGASCLTCHPTTTRRDHDLDAHLGCAGARCHSDATLDTMADDRGVCLVCHQEQEEHEMGQECATCHQVRSATRPFDRESAR